MTDPDMLRRAGAWLKEIRLRLGFSVREVQRRSQRISINAGKPDLFVSRGLLAGIEAGLYMPGAYKIVTLCEIYGITERQIHRKYGIDKPDADPRERPLFWPPNTQLLVTGPEADAGVDPRLVADLLDIWRDIPAPMTREIDTRKFLFGYIGASDRTLSPLLPPGTYVQIDPKLNRIKKEPPPNEAEPSLWGRPIYFLDLRKRYACGWCELEDGILRLIPHPNSGELTRTFRYPMDAEVVGLVTAVFFLPLTGHRPRRGEPGR
jgi:transcriptional regulator with XRE-family HTH domain